MGNLLAGSLEPPGTDIPSFSLPQLSLDATQPPTQGTEPTYVQVGTQEKGGLPCQLQYTTLVARQLAAYDGPYLEDGSDEELVDVAALVLENTGTIGMEYVQVVLQQGGRELVFDVTYVPPRGTVLILEKNRAAYSTDPVESCRCRTLISGNFDWEKEKIRIDSGDGFGMAVTNLTDIPMSYVRVFYKQHEGAADLYVGGITYSAVIPDLQPGETRQITPYRYADGYSAVVAVVIDP